MFHTYVAWFALARLRLPRRRQLGWWGFAVACILVGFPSLAVAQCESRVDTTPVDYLEYREARYTICYSAAYPDDLDFVDEWVSRAFDLGLQKYGVATPMYESEPFYLTVYLPGAATASTSQGLVRMACCYPDGKTTHAEIHYLTPSAWEGDVLGGLGQPPEHYHPHYITHEVVHFFQWACCWVAARDSGYRWPTWLTEGMAESDGYRHTTAYGGTTAIGKLHQRIREQEGDSVIYGQTLLSEQGFVVTNEYWAGGWVMNYLADRYGDEIHVDLLRQPLADVLSTYGASIGAFFSDLVDEYRRLDDPGPGSGKYPSMACTGRHWRSTAGLSFEVQILNNEQRPANHGVFQQQYRRDASRPWTTDRTISGVSGDRSGYSTPLFTSTSSPPFQWRARSCPSSQTTDGACSNWSNTINWTAETCARTRVD